MVLEFHVSNIQCIKTHIGYRVSAVTVFLSCQPQACISTGPQQQHGTFYEFCTYSIQPEKNAAFLSYWSVEYGGLNQVFPHLEVCYAQRAGVRASLAQDPNWIEEYISKAMLMLTSQDNEVTYLEQGVYELASFQMHPVGPAVWGEAFKAFTASLDGSTKVQWDFSLCVPVNALWWYESPDQHSAVHHKAHGDARVVAAGKPFNLFTF
uniref:Nipsnap homolog 3A (C. elegans) n=1 Tax=Hucho hucho TaxID=62062 RepID=A0A4W5NAT6_9TELE